MRMPLLAAMLFGALCANAEVAYVNNAGTPAAQVCVATLNPPGTLPVGPGTWDGAPRWSPDGAWIAFETGEIMARQIYVVRADGTDGRTLSAGNSWNMDPRWSTDGTRLVYGTAPSGGGLGGIAVYDLNSATERQWGGGRLGLLRPVWMPYTQLSGALDPEIPLVMEGVDMKRFLSEARMSRLAILSGSLPEAVVALQLVPGNEGTAGVRTTAVFVTENEVVPFLHFAVENYVDGMGALWHVEPSWEGHRIESNSDATQAFGGYTFQKKGEASRIAFESDEEGDREIYVLSKRGRVNVSNHRAADWNPVWSPDGRRLAFESFRDGPRRIFQVYTDTALVSPLIEADRGWSPTWSVSGEEIAYISDVTGEALLYVATVKTGKSRLIDLGAGAKAWPAWRPEQP